MAEGRKSIVISIFSTSSGNGKTVTAINLAASLANEGYAVCLVDLAQSLTLKPLSKRKNLILKRRII